MIQYIAKYLSLGLALVFMMSCQDQLNRFPLDEISSEDYWNTVNDMKLYVNQFYPSAFSVSGSDRYNHIFAADLPTDDMTYVEAEPRLRGSRVVPATGGWNYNQIRSVNYFLENYSKSEIEFDQYKRYVGEAHYFRAHYYFDMLKEYGDLPYISKPLETNSDELFSARTPRNQVVDNIIEDLDLAIQYLPGEKQEGGTRLNKDIALLLKSRVGLYEGTWEKYHSNDVFGVPNGDAEKYLRMAVELSLIHI